MKNNRAMTMTKILFLILPLLSTSLLASATPEGEPPKLVNTYKVFSTRFTGNAFCGGLDASRTSNEPVTSDEEQAALKAALQNAQADSIEPAAADGPSPFDDTE